MEKNNSQFNKIAIFQQKEIRKTIHNNEWWFVIEDVILVLTDSKDPKQYIQRLKQRDSDLKKNYKEKELDEFSTTEDFSVVQVEGKSEVTRIVTMYLDYSELQAVRNIPMYMKNWIQKLNAFLKNSVNMKF